MQNIEFINKYINGTKNGNVIWDNCSIPSNKWDKAYITKKNNTIIAITFSEEKYKNGERVPDEYKMYILDSSMNELYKIDNTNLEEGETEYNRIYKKNDSLSLSRLYRLADRSANKIDKLLAELSAGVDEEELPF